MFLLIFDPYGLNFGIYGLVAWNDSMDHYRSSMTAILTALQAKGASIILCVPTSGNNDQFEAGIATYKGVPQDLSATFNVPVQD